MTAFRAGIPAIDLDALMPRPFSLLVKLARAPPPTHITDGFCQTPVLDHILHRKVFKTDQLVLVNDLPGAVCGDDQAVCRRFWRGTWPLSASLWPDCSSLFAFGLGAVGHAPAGLPARAWDRNGVYRRTRCHV